MNQINKCDRYLKFTPCTLNYIISGLKILEITKYDLLENIYQNFNCYFIFKIILF